MRILGVSMRVPPKKNAKQKWRKPIDFLGVLHFVLPILLKQGDLIYDLMKQVLIKQINYISFLKGNAVGNMCQPQLRQNKEGNTTPSDTSQAKIARMMALAR